MLITVSHYIANLLKETDCDVIVLGGMYQKKSETVALTRLCIQQVHFNKAFIGIDGFQAETGFTGRDMMRADVVSAVLAKGVENIVLTDSSKFGQIQPNPLAAGPDQPGDHRFAFGARVSASAETPGHTGGVGQRLTRAATATRGHTARFPRRETFTCLSFPRNLYSSATFGP